MSRDNGAVRIWAFKLSFSMFTMQQQQKKKPTKNTNDTPLFDRRKIKRTNDSTNTFELLLLFAQKKRKQTKNTIFSMLCHKNIVPVIQTPNENYSSCQGKWKSETMFESVENILN